MTHKRINAGSQDGTYMEIWYMNNRHQVVDKTEATRYVIRKFTGDGKMLHETWGIINEYIG